MLDIIEELEADKDLDGWLQRDDLPCKLEDMGRQD